MGKGKKKRKIDQVSQFTNLTGFEGQEDGILSSMDDCMAEMVMRQQQRTSEEISNRQAQEQKNAIVPRFSSKESIHPSWIRQSLCISPSEIDSWNRSFVAWTSDHRYPPGLLPNIDEELARNFKIKDLSSMLLQKFKESDLRMPVFERWLLDSKLEENQRNQSSERDPVLPLQSSPNSEASRRLLVEILSNRNGNDGTTDDNVFRNEAENAIAELCRKTNVACQELLAQRDRYRRQSPLKKGDRIQIENDGRSATEIMTILYSRKKWKKPFIFKINRRHYVSLKDRFVEVHESYRRESFSTAMGNNSWPPSSLSKNGSSHVQTVERSFHVIVVALLLRYSALSGGQLLGDLRGGGMQGAIHSSVFEVLRAQFCSDEAQQGAWLEGFASPFNATLPRFASVFPDLDWHFGSVGNFFDCSFAWNSYESHGGEFCEANPPFTPGVIEHMAEHIFGVLAKAEESRRALSFIVVVPSAGKREKISLMTNEDDEAAVKQAAFRSFKEMITNKYCTKHLQLKAREHGYIEGAQHLRPTMYKQSSYDTSIIILQSPEAMRKFSVDSRKMCDLDTDLRHAFSSRHENELKWRKSLS